MKKSDRGEGEEKMPYFKWPFFWMTPNLNEKCYGSKMEYLKLILMYNQF